MREHLLYRKDGEFRHRLPQFRRRREHWQKLKGGWGLEREGGEEVVVVEVEVEEESTGKTLPKSFAVWMGEQEQLTDMRIERSDMRIERSARAPAALAEERLV